MTRFRPMTRVLLACDLRDPASMIFTFLVPASLLVALVLSFGHLPSASGGDSVNEVSSNVIAFGTAFVGIFAGATHLALWRENGMFRVLRSFPLTPGTIVLAQAAVGILFAIAQALLLVVLGSIPWLGLSMQVTAPLTLVSVVVGFLMFFFLGVLIGIHTPSMAGVTMLALLIVLPLGYVGGAMMPIEALPGWVQSIAPWTPVFHLRRAVSTPLIGVGSWADAAVGWAYLSGVAALLYAAVRSTFRWR